MVEIINEAGKVTLKGPLSQANKKNRNGRIYPKDVLREAVSKLISKVNKEPQSIYSELEHPEYTEIIPEKACGLITEVTWNEDEGISYCKVEILESTDSGKYVLEKLKEGKTFGISTRGLGSLKEGVVQDDLEFITADIIESIQSCQICRLTESENTLDDKLFEKEVKEECPCIYKQLTIKEKIEALEFTTNSFINIFKK